METIFEGLKIAFFGVLMFSIIVTIHEAGHFTAARLFGLRVKEFMLGLPGPNIGFMFKGTKFGVTPILLGGYALIAGENSSKDNPNLAKAYSCLASYGSMDLELVKLKENDLGFDLEEALDVLDAWGTIKREKKKGVYRYLMPADGEVVQGQARSVADADAHIAAERKLTFNGCPWYKRVIILSAGVIFNLLFAILVMSAVLMFVGTQSASTTVDVVSPNSAAEICGLESGDVLQVFDGQEVDSWTDFQALIANKEPGDKVSIQVDRNGQIVSLGATLTASDNGKALLGVTPTVIKEPISVFEAVKTSVSFIGLVADFIVQLLNPATFNEIVGQSSSVIGVSFEAKNAAESGFLPFIFLAAGLSVSIGLMNLLPFPPLDGGRIVVETIERVTRKRIPVAIISAVTIVGLVALVALFLYVTGNDIQRYILGGIGHGG